MTPLCVEWDIKPYTLTHAVQCTAAVACYVYWQNCISNVKTATGAILALRMPVMLVILNVKNHKLYLAVYLACIPVNSFIVCVAYIVMVILWSLGPFPGSHSIDPVHFLAGWHKGTKPDFSFIIFSFA